VTGPEVRVAVRATARVGEGPVWDPVRQVLRWVDIPAGLVHASRMVTGETAAATTTTMRLPMQVGAVAPAAGGDLVMACEQGFGLLAADGSFDVRLPVLAPGERMNDAKCDAAGRLWAGSTELDFSPGRGALHVLRPDWSTDIVLTDLTLPNGLGWSPASDVFYLADSEQRVIYAFDFDLRRAALSRRRTLIAFTQPDGKPDGLCTDSAGDLWVAMWGGSRVLRISPLGEIRAVVPMPVRQPSSCAFGGPELDVLYVTSAREGLILPPGRDALDGSVFAVDPAGATGTAPVFFGAPPGGMIAPQGGDTTPGAVDERA
jgi:sugar lactone lactonase YvrE